MARKIHSHFDFGILRQAFVASFRKLHPRSMMKNPVMFVTEAGAFLTTVGLLSGSPGESTGFALQVSVLLWFTVLFANFAEAMAEGRGKAQAYPLRKARQDVSAKKLLRRDHPQS